MRMPNFEDEDLIKEIRKYPFLFSMSHPKYRDILLKENTWKDIAKGLQCHVMDVTKRWKSLRDRFVRETRANVNGRINLGEKWRLAKNMEFLIKHMKRRHPKKKSEDKNGEDSQSSNAVSPRDGQDGILRGILEDTEEGDSVCPDGYYQFHAGSNPYSNSNSPSETNAAEESILPHSPKITAVFMQSMSSSSAEQLRLTDAVESAPCQPPKRVKVEPSEPSSFAEGHSNEVIQNNGLLDPVDYFCLSIAADMKKLPSNKLPVLKMKILQLICECISEEEAHRND